MILRGEVLSSSPLLCSGPVRNVATWSALRLYLEGVGPVRRMSKDYERLCETSQAMIHAVMSRLMLRRLARV